MEGRGEEIISTAPLRRGQDGDHVKAYIEGLWVIINAGKRCYARSEEGEASAPETLAPFGT